MSFPTAESLIEETKKNHIKELYKNIIQNSSCGFHYYIPGFLLEGEKKYFEDLGYKVYINRNKKWVIRWIEEEKVNLIKIRSWRERCDSDNEDVDNDFEFENINMKN
jgi:hypothetical protein